jgi:hypothetical protein
VRGPPGRGPKRRRAALRRTRCAPGLFVGRRPPARCWVGAQQAGGEAGVCVHGNGYAQARRPCVEASNTEAGPPANGGGGGTPGGGGEGLRETALGELGAVVAARRAAACRPPAPDLHPARARMRSGVFSRAACSLAAGAWRSAAGWVPLRFVAAPPPPHGAACAASLAE